MSVVKDMAIISMVGMAGYCTAKCMMSSNKKSLCKDARRMVDDMNDVREDMMHMAKSFKKCF